MQIAGELLAGGEHQLPRRLLSPARDSWCMESREGIEIKRGRPQWDGQPTVLNLRKYNNWLGLWPGGQEGPPASVNINIPDKYSCPGVQIVVTKWGSWVDVLFMMVMIIMLHKKEISISHYLLPRTTSLYFLRSRNISRSDSYSICENNV